MHPQSPPLTNDGTVLKESADLDILGVTLPCVALSGRIGKVVASHAAVARSSPAECTDLYYARGAQGVLPMRVGVRPVNWIYRL